LAVGDGATGLTILAQENLAVGSTIRDCLDADGVGAFFAGEPLIAGVGVSVVGAGLVSMTPHTEGAGAVSS